MRWVTKEKTKMASHYLRKYGVAATIPFELYKLDGTGLKADAASATTDIQIMKDEGAEGNTTADAFVDEGQGYSLALTNTEMTAARIVIYIVDKSSPQVWLDKVLIIETYGNASAQHIFDLGTATVTLPSTEYDNIRKSVCLTGDTASSIGKILYDFTATTIPAIKTMTDKIGTVTNTGGTATIGAILGDAANSALVTREANIQTEVNKIGTITNTGGTATIGAVLGDVANSAVAVRLTTIDDFLDTEIAAILADTNELQTDWVNGGRLDLLVDAIKAVTDLLTLAAIADAVHDEVTEGTTTLRQAVKLISSALLGKSSGGSTATGIYRDIGDTKPRITATMDVDGNRTAMILDGA
jgi:hypothetical protein